MSGDRLFLFDHEQAFSFVSGVIGWQPPWSGHGLDFYRNHVFFHQLKRVALDWNRLKGALAALTDARLGEYLAAVPNAWRADNPAAERITEYLREARQHRDELFAVISHLLK